MREIPFIRPLSIDARPARWLAGSVASIGFAGVVWACIHANPAALLGSALATVFGILFACSLGRLSIDKGGIEHRCAFGVFRMEWSEIEQIHTGYDDSGYMLVGQKKRFFVPPFGRFAGPEKTAFVHFFISLVGEPGLPTSTKPWVFGFSRGCRVRSRTSAAS